MKEKRGWRGREEGDSKKILVLRSRLWKHFLEPRFFTKFLQHSFYIGRHLAYIVARGAIITNLPLLIELWLFSWSSSS